jgi:hypothetical protein
MYPNLKMLIAFSDLEREQRILSAEADCKKNATLLAAQPSLQGNPHNDGSHCDLPQSHAFPSSTRHALPPFSSSCCATCPFGTCQWPISSMSTARTTRSSGRLNLLLEALSTSSQLASSPYPCASGVAFTSISQAMAKVIGQNSSGDLLGLPAKLRRGYRRRLRRLSTRSRKRR